ncbi:unnamed protein product [Parascedosporium putredinis]|uniref:Uncharacterized protein n=1 Tax=Parascedosporium putredinis TaxID=1442378 RepID=A0A9P1H054_9PEZI|nr:unnamed protein product [Parascedosporium putredinis]CAI7992352.1 unnamed protein product [Parascedosporium putredinis]
MILRTDASNALVPLALGLLQIHGALAAAPRSPSNQCIAACQLWLNQIPFDDIPADTPYVARGCAGTLGPTSLFLCSTRYCPEVDLVEGFRALNETCQRFGSHLPSVDLIAGYTDEELAKILRLQPADHPPKGPVKEVLLPAGPLFRNAVYTLNAVSYIHIRHIGFGLCVFFFWIIAILVGVGFRISHMFQGSVSEKAALARRKRTKLENR